MIRNVLSFIRAIEKDIKNWSPNTRPWFRGESGADWPPLTPKVAKWTADQENYLLQSFRRKAGGLANIPPRENHTDLWLFLAQHYGIDTRLLDWTEGALIALYFAVNRKNPKPKVYMLNPYKLNDLAITKYNDMNPIRKIELIEPPNFPLTWPGDKFGHQNIALAWELRKESNGQELPIAVPATYQDHRMIAQRSCFTIHGKRLESIQNIIRDLGENVSDYLVVYEFRQADCKNITHQLSYLGISQSSIFPDLDNLGKDIGNEILYR